MPTTSYLPNRLTKKINALRFLPNKIVVGTHHKTGTVWIRTIFDEIARRFGLEMVIRCEDDPPPEGRFDIFFHSHSQFEIPKLGRFRGVHIVRDPRDLIVSATHYHSHSDEPWLHIKRRDFGGLTYQEKLNSYESFSDQLLFEMEHASARNIRTMKDWNYDDGRFLNAKYERLIQDYRLDYFQKLFEHLEFRELAIGWCLVAAYRNSLFSGTVKSKHVRSGKPRQWPDFFEPVHRKKFDDLFGNVLEKMNYELDDDWLDLGKR
jgi:hypothetical protein